MSDQQSPYRDMPTARRAALRRVMQQRGISAEKIDAEIARYLAALDSIVVPSDAELQAMERRGELPPSQDHVHAPE